MKSKVISNASLLLLSIIFSIALVFAFLELPRLLDQGIQRQFGFPQFDQGLGDVNAFKTELFIQGLHLRWIGYGSLLLILILIIAGYATRKTGWALAGAVGLFIPVFGQFAFSMFFLAGLGILRVGWLPFMEASSVSILDMGKVIYVPYWILMWFFGLFNWNAHQFLSYFFMASGAFLFIWGVLVWFQSRYNSQQVASAWIYKISRHPQYLGWILWSYGFILFPPARAEMKITWSVPSSLPWLLMTMIIIGICMLEEIKMMKVTNGGYEAYRKKSPFLIPLPRWLRRPISWPARKIAGGEHPVRPAQVGWIILLYTGILVGLSLIWVDLKPAGAMDSPGSETLVELSQVVRSLDEIGDNRRGIYAEMKNIPRYGAAGTEALVSLAVHPNDIVREFSIQLLGEQNFTASEDIYLGALNDSVKRVRSSAILGAGNLSSERAADSLIQLLVAPRFPNNLFHIYGALGSIGQPKAIPYLVAGLDGGEWYNQVAALDAIFTIDREMGVEYAIRELQDEDLHIRQNAVIKCILSEDPQVVEPLKALFGDEDFEVRFYARQGVRRLTRKSTNGPPEIQ